MDVVESVLTNIAQTQNQEQVMKFLGPVTFTSIRSFFNDVLQLQNTRAADGKTTLVHYLAQVVEEKHPDLLQFTEELSYVERASRGQIESQAYMYYCKHIIFGENWFSKRGFEFPFFWTPLFLFIFALHLTMFLIKQKLLFTKKS